VLLLHIVQLAVLPWPDNNSMVHHGEEWEEALCSSPEGTLSAVHMRAAYILAACVFLHVR
jgi:hypothetical protein